MADGDGLDEGGLPKHLPMPVTRDGSGPEVDRPHHYVCWCGDPECGWNRAFREDRRLMFGRSRRLLGLALDEIYLLRGVMADEAMIIKAHLGYKTFPKTRRQIADEQVVRMALFAEGQLRAATRYGFDIVRALRLVEVPQVLTISRWLEQRGLENDKPDQFDSDAHPDTTGSNG